MKQFLLALVLGTFFLCLWYIDFTPVIVHPEVTDVAQEQFIIANKGVENDPYSSAGTTQKFVTIYNEDNGDSQIIPLSQENWDQLAVQQKLNQEQVKALMEGDSPANHEKPPADGDRYAIMDKRSESGGFYRHPTEKNALGLPKTVWNPRKYFITVMAESTRQTKEIRISEEQWNQLNEQQIISETQYALIEDSAHNSESSQAVANAQF